MLELGDAPRVAYFSMEIGLEPGMPTYSGGLGILAGDTLRAAADLGLPMVAVTLVHRQGYLRQRLDGMGHQREEAQPWEPERLLSPVDARVTVRVSGRDVQVRAWRHDVVGASGHIVPVFLLDTALPENAANDRKITDVLYGGDERNRLAQEIVLGIGGAMLLRTLGVAVRVYHMNEGHSALLTLALLRDFPPDAVRARCVFTTHTPVPAGRDRFPVALAASVLGDELSFLFLRHAPAAGGVVDMTHLAIALSRTVNAVALRHADVARAEYPGREVLGVTNGVHPAMWAGPNIASLLDRHAPGWRSDGALLRYAAGTLPLPELAAAHREQKTVLLAEVTRRSGVSLDGAALTLAFARRMTAYKRADLVLRDLGRLATAAKAGPIQIVFAGKAHPRDAEGKRLIAQVAAIAKRLTPADGLRVVFVPDHDIVLARLLVAGADVWLNTPRKPLEASGTSGMKAAINGVPSLSVLDGWWVEGHIEGVTGWRVGGPPTAPSDDEAEAASLYDTLERTIAPLYYEPGDAFTGIRRSTLALNGSFFNTHRMVREYFGRVYAARADDD